MCAELRAGLLLAVVLPRVPSFCVSHVARAAGVRCEDCGQTMRLHLGPLPRVEGFSLCGVSLTVKLRAEVCRVDA